ncbi:hypothetical protein ACU4GI_32960 [Cupriavidus basilensis]
MEDMKIADKVKEALSGADPMWANESANLVQAILERAMQMSSQELFDFLAPAPAMQKYAGKIDANTFEIHANTFNSTRAIIATML